MKIVVAQDALNAEGGVGVVSRVHHSCAPLQRSLSGVVVCPPGTRGDTRSRGGRSVCRCRAPHDRAAFAGLRAWGADVCFSNNMARLDVERRALDEWPVVKFMHGYFGTCISALKTHAFPFRTACSRTLGPACLALYAPRHCGAHAMAPWRAATGGPVGNSAAGALRRGRRRQRPHGGRVRTARCPSRSSRDASALPLADASSLPLPRTGRERAVSRTHDRLKGGDLLIRAVSRAATDG